MKRLMCLLLVGLTFANNVNSHPPIPKTAFELYSHELPYTPKEGRVVVTFTIDEKGNVEEPKMVDINQKIFGLPNMLFDCSTTVCRSMLFMKKKCHATTVAVQLE